MKFSPIFQQFIDCKTSQDIFNYLNHTLTDSITGWDYFVNWNKVLSNFREVEINLNTLNYLIGKSDIEAEFKLVLEQHPRILNVIPILIACRTADFKILTNYASGDFQYKYFKFKNKGVLTTQEIDEAFEFIKETGILELFQNKTIKSIPDYVLGVEVGLDSNGRKNRGGDMMETIVEELIKALCAANNFNYIKQATADKIFKAWNIVVEVDKSSRRFDFAINNQGLLYLVEVNFYGGGGSKLKATAGEYKALFNFLSAQNHKFIWLTDGLGWKSTLKPLEETFNHIDYTLNLNMSSTGLLAEIIKQKL
jgi:type II restriction enzyme